MIFSFWGNIDIDILRLFLIFYKSGELDLGFVFVYKKNDNNWMLYVKIFFKSC